MPNSGFEGLLTGHTLAGRYHVEEVIGRGGFAAVYRATDQRLGRTVAVKVITQSAVEPGDARRHAAPLRRARRAPSPLPHHPNVVTVLDFGADPDLGLDFLVMELLRGEVLSDRLKRAEPTAVPEALRILRDAASGVDAGHRAGLIHRDIKPGNIFLSRPEHGGPARVSVLDFGIARFTEAQETRAHRTSGRGPCRRPTPARAASWRAALTPASDVFSLGVIGYHLLAREKPFGHDRMQPGPYARAPAPLRERNPAVPAAVAAVIEQAMRDEPAARYPDAGAFVHALVEAESAAEGQGSAAAAPVAAPDTTLLQPPTPVAGATSAAGEVGHPLDEGDDAPADAVREHERVPGGVAPPPVRAAAAPVVAAAASEPPRTAPRPPITVPDTRGEPRPPPPQPPVPAPARPVRKMNSALLGIPLLLVIAIALWLTMGRRGKRDRVAAGPSSTASGTSAATVPASDGPQASGTAAAGEPATSQPAAGGSQAGTGGSQQGPAASSTGAAGSPARSTNGAAAPTGGGIAATPPAAPSPAVRPPVVAPPASAPADAGGAGAMGMNREGEAMFERGETDGAIGRFRAAVRAAPGNAYYHNNLGWALFQAGKVDEAGRELNEAVRLDPRRDIAYANIGEVERARGNIPAAIAAYERFLQLNTNPRRERIAREKLRTLRGGYASRIR